MYRVCTIVSANYNMANAIIQEYKDKYSMEERAKKYMVVYQGNK